MKDATLDALVAAIAEDAREKNQAFLAAHPAIEANKPHWARKIELPFEPNGDVTCGVYVLEHGIVGLTQDFSLRDGTVTLVGPPTVTLYADHVEATTETLRSFASDLITARQRFENATIQ